MRNIWNFVQYPTRLGVVVMIIFLIALAVPVLALDERLVDRIETAMIRLCKLAPNHPIVRRPDWRRQLAIHIVDAAQKYNEDPYLLTTVIYCESSFRPNVTGKIGEVGLGQVHGVAARGCELKTPRGQIMCSAKWLATSRLRCNGTHRQALSMYASGKTCHPGRGGSLDSLVRRRLRIYGRISRRID